MPSTIERSPQLKLVDLGRNRLFDISDVQNISQCRNIKNLNLQVPSPPFHSRLRNAYYKTSSFIKVPRHLPLSGVWSRCPSIVGHRPRDWYEFNNPTFKKTHFSSLEWKATPSHGWKFQLIQGVLVFKPHRCLHHSTLGSRTFQDLYREY